jgi:hypothetical protein
MRNFCRVERVLHQSSVTNYTLEIIEKVRQAGQLARFKFPGEHIARASLLI